MKKLKDVRTHSIKNTVPSICAHKHKSLFPEPN